MKSLITALVLLFTSILSSQTISTPTLKEALDTFGFTEEKIIVENDTITYYLKNYTVKPKNLVVHIQGTDANPIFSYSQKDGKNNFFR